MSALAFHRLQVVDVEALTDDAAAISLAIPDELRETFRFLPGQHVTMRAVIDGEDVRRSYSISVPPDGAQLRVGVKRVPGGAFSTYATTELTPGDTLEVMPPVGEFTLSPDPGSGGHYVAIAAGSGITPVMSMITTALTADPSCRFTLVYGNRDSRSIMFLEELESLKDRHHERFHLINVLSREPQPVDLFTGRIDRAKLDLLLERIIDPEQIDEWFLCGPFGLIETAREALTAAGVDTGRIHDELFFAGDEPPVPLVEESEAQDGSVLLGFTIDGRRSTVGMEPEQTILEAALRVRGGLPFSCKGGMCATCKARLVEGEVTMVKNYALVGDEVAAGYILTCQSHPTTEVVEVDYDV